MRLGYKICIIVNCAIGSGILDQGAENRVVESETRVIGDLDFNSKRFRALVNRIDEIQEAYSLTGDADYVLKAVLRDLKGLSNLVNDVLMPHQSVAHVRSSIVLDRLKESSRLPLREIKPG